jgi:hypothetical protein
VLQEPLAAQVPLYILDDWAGRSNGLPKLLTGHP